MPNQLRPFFPYYGSKWRSVPRYPAPDGPLIEQFAGSAGYATYHNPSRVLLVDKDPAIVGVWSYLTRATPAEILALPDLLPGESVNDIQSIPQEARWLIGYWLNRGSAVPKITQTAWSVRHARPHLVWGEYARQRCATQVPHIRHWRVREGSYEDVYETGTAFVDPPYTDKGRYYRHHAVDYADLAGYCRTRPGLTIVCEQAGATWLPFEPLATIKSTRGTSAEVVYVRRA